MTTEATKQVLGNIVELTKDEALMLWQLMNAQNSGAPFSASHIAASLFAKVRAAAIHHGIAQA